MYINSFLSDIILLNNDIEAFERNRTFYFRLNKYYAFIDITICMLCLF